MSDFVADCRREWKRLRVPDSIADEMAAELAADLGEAADEGVSAEDVLGAGALDPRSFAASWAAERGVTDPRSARKRHTGSLALAAIAVLSVAAIAAGAAWLASPSATTSAGPPDHAAWQAWNVETYGGMRPVMHTVMWIDAGRPGVHTATVAIKASALAPWDPPLPPSEQGSDTDGIAWALLIAGVVGLVFTTLAWWRARRQRTTPPTANAASYA